MFYFVAHVYIDYISNGCYAERSNWPAGGAPPFQAQWCQMITLQSVQGHTGLTPAF